MRLTVIVISFNTRDLTLGCLKSLQDVAVSGDFEVRVVDNCSVDGSAQAITHSFPQSHLKVMDKNIGFARANNLAAAEARGEWLLLLNPDTIVINNAIAKLCALADARPDVGIFGGRTIFSDGSLNSGSCWRRPTLWSVTCQAVGLSSLFPRVGWTNPEAMGSWKRDTMREVDIISGCFLLIRRSLWERLGGFDEEFFMYGEDADLCLRAKRLGVRCLACPDATIIHYGGASEAARADKMIRLFTAKRKLFERHWVPAQIPYGIFMLYVWALTRIVAFGVASRFGRRYRGHFTTWMKIWAERSKWAGQGTRVSRSRQTLATFPEPSCASSELLKERGVR